MNETPEGPCHHWPIEDVTGALYCDLCGALLQEATWCGRLSWWWECRKRPYCEFMAWLRPCDDCGRRFGKHDDSVEHSPF